MRLLLDTHAFVWWTLGDARLSAPARVAIQDPENDVVLSVVSAWELVIKAGLGRAGFEDPLLETVTREIDNGMRILPIHLRHAVQLAELPKVHGDPFDRMLVAQALEEGLRLVTRDRMLHDYPVSCIW